MEWNNLDLASNMNHEPTSPSKDTFHFYRPEKHQWKREHLSFSRAVLTYTQPLCTLTDLNEKKTLVSIFVLAKKSHASMVCWSSSCERNSSIKQLFKLPVGSSTACKIYEQQYKETVDGSKRVLEAAGRESLAITTQSITSSTRHIQPRAPQQCIQNIFPHSRDRSSVIISYCGSACFYYMCEGIRSPAISIC